MATGTNPAVNSVYARIMAGNPAIKGHNTNLAQGGATVRDLVSQAELVGPLLPKPDLVLIQIMDNDIDCPTTPASWPRSGRRFEPRSRPSRKPRLSRVARRQSVRKPHDRGEVAHPRPAQITRRHGAVRPPRSRRTGHTRADREARESHPRLRGATESRLQAIPPVPVRRRRLRPYRGQSRVRLLGHEPLLDQGPRQGRGRRVGGADATRCPTAARLTPAPARTHGGPGLRISLAAADHRFDDSRQREGRAGNVPPRRRIEAAWGHWFRESRVLICCSASEAIAPRRAGLFASTGRRQSKFVSTSPRRGSCPSFSSTARGRR